MGESQYYLSGQQLGRLIELSGTFGDSAAAQEFCALTKTIVTQRLEFRTAMVVDHPAPQYPGQTPFGAGGPRIGDVCPGAAGPQQGSPAYYQGSCHHGGEHTWDFRDRAIDGVGERYCVKCGAVSAA